MGAVKPINPEPASPGYGANYPQSHIRHLLAPPCAKAHTRPSGSEAAICDIWAMSATVRYRTATIIPSETEQNDFRTCHSIRTPFSDNQVTKTKFD